MPDYLEPKDDGLVMRESGAWAVIKLDYLARYIDVFEKAMRQKWPVRYYIDIMAGPGKNRVRESGAILLGSPILALTTRYPFTNYFFADLSEENTMSLKQRCAASPLYHRADIRTGDCNVLVNDIVAQIKRDDRRSLSLAFIDPEGMADLHWKTVAELATVQRMDLIINYPQGGLNRYMCQAFEKKEQTIIDDFFGNRVWRKIYKEWLDKKGFPLHRHLIDLYKQGLKDLGYAEVFRGDEGLEDEPLIRNIVRNAPLYRLLFASKHQRGLEFWHKVTHRNVYGQARLL